MIWKGKAQNPPPRSRFILPSLLLSRWRQKWKRQGKKRTRTVSIPNRAPIFVSLSVASMSRWFSPSPVSLPLAPSFTSRSRLEHRPRSLPSYLMTRKHRPLLIHAPHDQPSIPHYYPLFQVQTRPEHDAPPGSAARHASSWWGGGCDRFCCVLRRESGAKRTRWEGECCSASAMEKEIGERKMKEGGGKETIV